MTLSGRLNVVVSPCYKPSLIRAFGFQLLITGFCLCVADMGETIHAWAAAQITYWIAAMLIAIRRPQNPTETDLRLIQFGYLPLFFITWLYAFAINDVLS